MADFSGFVLLSFFGLSFGERERFFTLGVFVNFVLFRSSDDVRIFFLKFIASADLNLLSFRSGIEEISAARGLARSTRRFEDVDGLLHFDEVGNHLVHEHLDDLFGLSLGEAVC